MSGHAGVDLLAALSEHAVGLQRSRATANQFARSLTPATQQQGRTMKAPDESLQKSMPIQRGTTTTCG
eukprot:3626924-Alexandrium_andersonii.AAC.1